MMFHLFHGKLQSIKRPGDLIRQQKRQKHGHRKQSQRYQKIRRPGLVRPFHQF